MSSAKLPQERTKVVVRNLPPTLGVEAFKDVLDKHVSADSYTWLQYYPGKISLKRTVFSRAFINFNTAQDVVEFKTRFEGHLFVSARGTQYRCTVEYAPFQKVPATRTKKLPMEGTIEKDPEYQAFVKEYEEGPRPAPTAQALLEAHEAARAAEEAKGPIVTALMAFLQQKYEAGSSLGGRRGARGTRSSGSGAGSRRETGGRLSTVEEDDTTISKGSKARSSKSSKSDAAATAAAAAAAAGAATQALKGSKHKPSKQTAAADQQPDSGRKLVSRHSSGGSRGADAASADSGHSRGKAASRGAVIDSSAAAESSRRGSKTRSTTAEEDEQEKAAAAAALAAASAANAAAVAARKARVKAGHQVYTPGAGGRLFAAAMSKSAGETAAGSSCSRGKGRDTDAAGSSKGKGRGENAAATDAALRPAAAARGIGEDSSRKSGEGGPRKEGPTGGRADGGSTGGGNSSSTARKGGKAAAGGAGDVAATTAAMSQLDLQGGGNSSSSRGGRGGRSGGRGVGRAGRGQHSSQQQHQQQWVPKAADGAG